MSEKGKAVTGSAAAKMMMINRPFFPLPSDEDANQNANGNANANANEDANANENENGNGEGGSKVPGGFPPPHGHPPLPYHPRHTSSKYDFVKVQVWLGDNADHYYVLSRFLVSRMLTVTKIPHHVAIKISLELKKLLIDNNLLDVSQSDLEANLFKLMERRGYGEEYINRYKMMTRFHHQRVPLVILVCGTACSGKSTIATQLAQRLNLPNVLQTDMVYELLRTSRDAPLPSVPVWEREFSSSEELITEFCRECRIVRKGLEGDVKKAMKDGKPIIIEGMHLDPGIYLINEESGVVPSNSNEAALDASPNPAISDADMPITREQSSVPSNPDCSLAVSSISALENPDMLIGMSNVAEERLHDDASNITEEAVPNGFTRPHNIRLKEASKDNSSNTRAKEPLKEFSKKQSTEIFAKAIVVPVVLKMDELDHKTLLEEWISCRCNISGVLSQVNKDDIVDKLMTIQEYLCSFESQGMIVVNISVTTFPQTLDQLHSYLLQRIEEGCSSFGTQK